MPEGPSLVYIKNQIKHFAGRKVTAAGGYGPMPKDWLLNKKLLEVNTFGKQLLLRFKDGTVSIHLMLFGSLLINEQKKVNASFYLKFGKDELNFYVVRAVKITQTLSEVFDWRTDILSSQWSAAFVLKKMKEHEKEAIGDLLMNQKIFTGVGNIIRNEVLYRARVHPLTLVKNMPVAISRKLLKEVRLYAREFLKEKIAGTFGDNWEVYEQEECPADATPLKKAMLGKTKRKTYYCSNCQVLYHGPAQSK